MQIEDRVPGSEDSFEGESTAAVASTQRIVSSNLEIEELKEDVALLPCFPRMSVH